MTAQCLPLLWQLLVTTILERKTTFSTSIKTCCELLSIFMWMVGATWKFKGFHHCLVWSKQIMLSCVFLMSINFRWTFFWVYWGFIQHFIILYLHLKKPHILSQDTKHLTLLLPWSLSDAKGLGVIRSTGVPPPLQPTKCSDIMYQADCFLKYI